MLQSFVEDARLAPVLEDLDGGRWIGYYDEVFESPIKGRVSPWARLSCMCISFVAFALLEESQIYHSSVSFSSQAVRFLALRRQVGLVKAALLCV